MCYVFNYSMNKLAPYLRLHSFENITSKDTDFSNKKQTNTCHNKKQR